MPLFTVYHKRIPTLAPVDERTLRLLTLYFDSGHEGFELVATVDADSVADAIVLSQHQADNWGTRPTTVERFVRPIDLRSTMQSDVIIAENGQRFVVDAVGVKEFA